MENQYKYKWWQKGIVYQVYPRSFYDSNNDGIGDLPGITEKLGYLDELGVKGIWISPIYPSPMVDFGYDIMDYTGIHPMYGTMDDFNRLLREIHNRDMKLILDFVPNHTSDRHPWFLESKKSRKSPKRDWYIWEDPKPDGSPPNNWLSAFGGSAWEFDEQTGQYYYHAYLKEQPDLNWRNPEVKEAMLEVMRFWLDKGVDGLRVDAVWHVIKDDQLRDDPVSPDYDSETMSPYYRLNAKYSADRPEVHDVIRLMREVVDEYDERVLIGEIYLPVKKLMVYHELDKKGAHLPFNFQLIGLMWNARRLEAVVNEYEKLLPSGSWPNWILGNHDRPRIASRVGRKQARIAAILLLTLRGTPTMYYGDELGMTNVVLTERKVKDPFEKNVPGQGLGRDPVRTPMQWDQSKNAGFTDEEPWLPPMKDYEEINVATEQEDPDSMLNMYKRLIELRANEPALHIGRYIPRPHEGDLFCFKRSHSGKEFLIILNISGTKEKYNSEYNLKGIVRLSTYPEREGEELSGEINVQAGQGLVIEILQGQL